MQAAVDWLRTKGLAKAAKKSGRTAAEGLVAVAHPRRRRRGPSRSTPRPTSWPATRSSRSWWRASPRPRSTRPTSRRCGPSDLDGKSVTETITDRIATIGENLALRRMERIEGETVASYVHNATAPGMGRIGVLVAMTGGTEEFGRQVAMHVAAINPAALDEGDLDPAIVERERQVLADQARESGKPEGVIEKMIEGRMKKFLAEITLLNQPFVVNSDLTVGQAAKDAGAEITGFRRLAVGEGIDRPEEDFAAEVAKVAQG